MSKILKVKIKNRVEFECGVFGGEDLIQHFPNLLSTGADVIYQSDMWYLCDVDKNIMSDCAFFAPEEMQYLEII